MNIQRLELLSPRREMYRHSMLRSTRINGRSIITCVVRGRES